MWKKFSAWANSPRATVISLSLIYLAVSVALLPRFRYIINPDGISYIAIARRYLAGDWQGAVNGYWGPLYSWALVPFLALRIDPLLAGRLLAILVGLATIPGLAALASRFALSGPLRAAVLAALLPALWRFTFNVLTPDFLIAGVLVWYFSLVFAPGFLDRRRNAVFGGVCGALAYFAKPYGFYFFLAHFTLMAALLWLGGENPVRRRAALRNYAAGLAVFALLAGGWAAALSGKYGAPTVATAGRYNHAYMGPHAQGHPMHRGFLAPSDAQAISIWEDPSSLSVPDWSATASVGMMKHQARLIVRNLRDMVRIFNRHSPLAPAILFACVLLCVRARGRSLRPGGDAFPLLSLLLYSAGYALILVEERYLYIVLILLALMGARLLQRLAEKGFLAGWRQTAAWLILALSMAVPPAKQTATLCRLNPGLDLQTLSVRLAGITNLKGNIASNRNWEKTLYVAYHLGLRYFGEQGKMPVATVVPTLTRMDVRYYFVWGSTAARRARFQAYPEVTGGKIVNLRIYQLPGPREEPGPAKAAEPSPRP